MRAPGKEDLTTHPTAFDAGSSDFRWTVPIAELRNPGVYTVWVQKAFGFNVINVTERLPLPTEQYPAEFEVIEANSASTVIGGALGVLCVLMLMSLGVYATQNYAKFKRGYVRVCVFSGGGGVHRFNRVR